MTFKVSFCDPFKRDIIEHGDVEHSKIMEMFDNIPFSELLVKMEDANESDIHYSPSFEVINTDINHGLSLTAIDETEWFIFYKRPKNKKLLFGLFTKMDNNYNTTIQGQTIDDARECLKALINNSLEYLEDKVR